MVINRRGLVRAGRKLELTWRYLFNFAPSLAFQFGRDLPSGEAARVLADLNRDGVAITSATRLLGQHSCFNELNDSVDRLEHFELADEIAATRANVNDTAAIGQKSFILPLLGDYPELDPDAIYARFGLQKPILQIANAYFGMYTRLRYYNIWHTFASTSDARESQLWHRDREDYYILKVFAYLSDVDSSAGPFTYARGTHPKGRLRKEPECFDEGGVQRSRDAQLAKVVPPDRWIECVGPKSTIIFADTRGYHKGGLARESDRIMYTCMFTSPASQSHEFLRRSNNISRPSDTERAFALAAPHRGLWSGW